MVTTIYECPCCQNRTMVDYSQQLPPVVYCGDCGGFKVMDVVKEK